MKSSVSVAAIPDARHSLLLEPARSAASSGLQPGEDDDAICRANNVAAGSPEYIACRKDRDVLRNNASAPPTAVSAISANT